MSTGPASQQQTSIPFNQYHPMAPIHGTQQQHQQQLPPYYPHHIHNNNNFNHPHQFMDGVTIAKRKRRVLLDEEAEKIIKEEEREEFVRVLHDQYSKVDVSQLGTLPEAKNDPAVHLPTDDSWEYWMSVMLQYQSFRSFPMYTEDEEQQQKQLEWQREMRFQLMQKKRAIKREKRRMFKLKSAWVNKRKGDELDERPCKRTKSSSATANNNNNSSRNEPIYTEAGNGSLLEYEEGDVRYYMDGDDSLLDEDGSFSGSSDDMQYESHYLHSHIMEHNTSGYHGADQPHHHHQQLPSIGFYDHHHVPQQQQQHLPSSHPQHHGLYPSNQSYHNHNLPQLHQPHVVPPAGYYQPM